jgi:DNA-directed RNA polymerase specialized sigma24 family protein
MPSTREADPPPEADEAIDWVADLASKGPRREAALTELHAILVRFAHVEVRRRDNRLGLAGPELEDLAEQAADDAVLAIMAKLDTFRGESRFTTWAYAFVIREVSNKLGRHFWRRPTLMMDTADWERLPDRFGMGPAESPRGAERSPAARLHRDRRGRHTAGRPRREAGLEPQRPLQDDVRHAPQDHGRARREGVPERPP